MKYIKKFENVNVPQIGDYAIVDNTSVNKNLNDFLSNNIAEIVDKYEIETYWGKINYYKFKYENIPFGLSESFSNDTIGFTELTIGYFSKNKEDVEARIQSKKYNL